MCMSEGVIELMGNPKMTDLFKRILKSRILSRSQLVQIQSDTSSLEVSLQQLQDLGLIKERRSEFDDFNKYYPTKEGLEMEKMVK